MIYDKLNGQTIAYVGDAYWSLLVRKYLIDKGITKAIDLQKNSIKFVSAKAQANFYEIIKEANCKIDRVPNDESDIQKLYLAIKDNQIEQLALKNHLKIERVDKAFLDKVCKSTNHQGVAVLKNEYKEYTVEQIVESAKGHNGLIVMLDELNDPHNLGAILRTCDCVGADGVIIKKNNAVGLNSTVAKVSVGAINTVKVASVTNIILT